MKLNYTLKCITCGNKFVYTLDRPEDPTAYSSSSCYCPKCYASLQKKTAASKAKENAKLCRAIRRAARQFSKGESAQNCKMRIRVISPNSVIGYIVGVVSILHAWGEEPLMLVSAWDMGPKKPPRVDTIGIHWTMLSAFRSAFNDAVDEVTARKLDELMKPTQDELEHMAEQVARGDEEEDGEA